MRASGGLPDDVMGLQLCSCTLLLDHCGEGGCAVGGEHLAELDRVVVEGVRFGPVDVEGTAAVPVAAVEEQLVGQHRDHAMLEGSRGEPGPATVLVQVLRDHHRLLECRLSFTVDWCEARSRDADASRRRSGGVGASVGWSFTRGPIIGQAATELRHAVEDPAGPRCRSCRAVAYYLRDLDRIALDTAEPEPGL